MTSHGMSQRIIQYFSQYRSVALFSTNATFNKCSATSRSFIRYSWTGLLVVGTLFLATQQAQAFSVLGVLNSVSVTGVVVVSKDILYGDAPL